MVDPTVTRRGQMDVLGENEALQQFFDSQDVSGVLDNVTLDTRMLDNVTLDTRMLDNETLGTRMLGTRMLDTRMLDTRMLDNETLDTRMLDTRMLDTRMLDTRMLDTRMLEQYLSNDVDPSTFMLPDSPPDSGSEPCSPPQVPDIHYGPSWPIGRVEHEVLSTLNPPTSSGIHFRDQHPSPQSSNLHLPGPQCPTPHLSAPMDTFPLGSCSLAPSPVHSSPPPLHHPSSAHTYAPVHASTQLPDSRLPNPLWGAAMPPCPVQTTPRCPSPIHLYPPPASSQQTGPASCNAKKRRHSTEDTPDPGGWEDAGWTLEGPDCSRGDAPSYGSDVAGGGGGPGQGAYRMLSWDEYLSDQWGPLYNSNYESLPVPGYHIESDKGFNYSPADEAFVCQKKNHFQVTVHVGMAGSPRYVKTALGLKPIQSFHVKVFGVKMEAPSHLITIEQSQSDRSKKPFLPVRVSMPGDKITKVTLGRLHFSETTANNMRKKGKPNPDQRYFLLVVGLYACLEEERHLLAAHVSERIIVRASNPGQFENDEMPWQRGAAPDAVVCHGRVGINTDAPDEALVVCGNVKVMGTVMHPSDQRAKENVQEVDSNEQLKRIAQMRIVEYDYKPEFATKMGINQVHETGIIAQEVKELLPSAVREVGDVVCSDGEKIPNFLMVDKEQIFMENVGAVKQLCKLTDNLETRIQELEVWNKRLAKLKDMGSLRSSGAGSVHRKVSKISNVPPPQKSSPVQSTKEKYKHCLQHKAFRGTVIVLVAIMAFCVICIIGLYMFTLQRDTSESSYGTSKTPLPPMTIPSVTTVPSTPGPWPPDVGFCSLLYCEEVYCCPTESGNLSSPYTEPILSYSPPSAQDKKRELLFDNFNGAKDWTNTTVKSIFIKENQQIIDHHYCVEGSCGPGNYSFSIPISKFVPVNMPITIQMNTTELLVVHLCHIYDTSTCSALRISNVGSSAISNTQGYNHEWPLPVARLHQSSFHFRTTVAGQADCTTDANYMEALFTDYHFHFYRRCD
uniref:Myelin regulatory factor like n=1 Tax=Paramormyrops kingsleyae TaxID=1676925 RepID=A0A3B3QMK4_9TELE|nr:myelin regulatory factor-like protein [Paramormyrops kingsleyae]XP_023681597.1 myelin regulatory factor-like protein [Paramormyrops kingsleyae]XP_023681606.1 myelin regulatory factor-like protein [Paramormyrops kingsleyae]